MSRLNKPIRDLFQPILSFSIMEDASDSVVDGVHVLAKVKGEFFFPDGMSRNQRFYPRQAWENVINDPSTKDRLEKRLMFGTVGHDQEINDKALREGKISHYMGAIYIENGKGIGEAYIMNTPVGAVLNTLLRSGCQLHVSSRADGRFKGRQNGVPAIDPDNFSVIGWDFVIDPGFLDATPEIVESLRKLEEIENPQGEEENMAGAQKEPMEKLIEHITGENHEIKGKNAELMTENLQLKESNTILADENKALKESAVAAQSDKAVLEAFQAIGSVDDIKKVMSVSEKVAETLNKYKTLGTPGEIAESLKAIDAHVKDFTEQFGTTREVAAVFREARQLQERLGKIGTLPEIEKMAEGFGKLIEDGEEAAAEADKQAKMKQAEDLAKELGVDAADVMKEMEAGKSPEEIKAMFKKVEEALLKKHGIKAAIVESKAPAAKPSPYAKQGINESKPTPKSEVSESRILHREESGESSILGKSRIERMNEAFSK